MLEILVLIGIIAVLIAVFKKDNKYSEMERRQAMQRSLRKLQDKYRQPSL